MMRRAEQYIEAMKSPRLRASPYVSATFDGRKLIGVGSELMLLREDATYADAVIAHLSAVLGEHWLRIESGQAPEQRHVVARWLNELADEIRAAAAQLGVTSGPVECKPTGTSKALTVLADDIFQLSQVMLLPPSLCERLRDRHKFQGSRYEVAAASLFARAGFKPSFIAPCEVPTPEFLAIDRTTGESVYLEAKSIYRAGVLHTPTNPQHATDSISNRKRVIAKMKAACKQNPGDRAFVVFIDLNRPALGGMGYLENIFGYDVQRFLQQRQAHAPDRKCDVSAVALTNFGWHYHREVDAPVGGYFWFPSEQPRFPLSERAASLLGRALSEYGWIPDEELRKQEIRDRFPEVGS